jgi:hypothetical protein
MLIMNYFFPGAIHANYQCIKKKIFSGVDYFARNSKGTLKDVRLVFYSQKMLDEFMNEGGSGTPAPSEHAGNKYRRKELDICDFLTNFVFFFANYTA